MALVQRLDVAVVDDWPQARLLTRSEKVSVSPAKGREGIEERTSPSVDTFDDDL